MELYIRAFITITRYLLPVLSAIMSVICAYGLLKKRVKPYKLILLTDDMEETVIGSGEYLIGSDSQCDIVLDGTKPRHAVLSVSNNYMKLRPVDKQKVAVNRKNIKNETRIAPDELITLGDREFSVRMKNNKDRATGKDIGKKAIAFACLNLTQVFMLISLLFAFPAKAPLLLLTFSAVIVSEWVYMLLTRFLAAFLEIPVMFLVTLGFTVVAHNTVTTIMKQFICLAVGIIASVLLAKFIELPKRAIGFKGIALIIGIALFTVNMVYGVVYNGAQNWLKIAGFSFQPSELIKVILIFISGACAEKLSSRKDAAPFVAFALFCLGALAYLSDFGTALIYAVTLAVLLFIRFCSFKLLYVFGGAALVGGGAVMLFFPYVAKRFFSFGKAFEHAADSGYQQTRAMISAASGGLFGVGGGEGTLVKVAAYDTDIVFGLIVEEWGLIIGLCALFFFVILMLYAVKTLTVSSSRYYSVTCCAAAVMLLTQASLNVFGSLDMLPFTGVTLPFISNGGSSLISCIMLIAFFRAAVRDEHIILSERRRKDE
ncbi:MAG: FtsW/RodA/SpoVE family cell cycle protein [Acutalibacteraceae bacterium]|nr:FtsW/RodA/SpoVE family cell cycle protein [Acutalibacteraceae bacterium]